MQHKIAQSVIAGVAATLVMTLFMIAGAAMGMPEINPPAMLAGMMNVSLAAGWIFHFMIGVVFAAGYVFLFKRLLRKISNRLLRGAVFGVIAFVIAQVALPIMEALFGPAAAPTVETSMPLLIIGSIMGHIVFGIVVSLFVKEEKLFARQIF